MYEEQQMLKEFMNKFEQTEHMNSSPTIPSEKTKELALSLIKEEIKETLEAAEQNDIVGVADGICDSTYVLLWMACAYGIEIEPLFNEVHRSNMSKLWPDGVHFNELGKVVKSPNYSPARIKELLQVQLDRPCCKCITYVPETLGSGWCSINRKIVAADSTCEIWELEV